MSDTYWFDLVHTNHSFAPLNIGAHRASQIARHINECPRSYDYDSELILAPLDLK